MSSCFTDSLIAARKTELIRPSRHEVKSREGLSRKKKAALKKLVQPNSLLKNRLRAPGGRTLPRAAWFRAALPAAFRRHQEILSQ
jgi:hypothetical protein